MSNGQLQTSIGDFAATGQVSLTSGKGGAKFVQLDGQDSYVTLGGDAFDVLSNPGSCQLGFTLTFTAQLQSLDCDSLYILTSGADLEDYRYG